jgi:predicted deacetylase
MNSEIASERYDKAVEKLRRLGFRSRRTIVANGWNQSLVAANKIF